MKDKFLKILILSAIITTIGFVLDGDLVELSVIMRFIEYFAMLGIVFLLISTVFILYNQLLKYVK